MSQLIVHLQFQKHGYSVLQDAARTLNTSETVTVSVCRPLTKSLRWLHSCVKMLNKKITDIKISRYIIVGIIKGAVCEIKPVWIGLCRTSPEELLAAFTMLSLFEAWSDHDNITGLAQLGSAAWHVQAKPNWEWTSTSIRWGPFMLSFFLFFFLQCTFECILFCYSATWNLTVT